MVSCSAGRAGCAGHAARARGVRDTQRGASAAPRALPPPTPPPCSSCFHGCGRHDRIREYNTWVNSVAAGEFQTAVTSGNVHEVNPRDRIIIGSLLDKLRIAGSLSRAELDSLPYNTLREW